MSNPKLTDRVIEQGRALAYAVEAIDSVEIKDPLERAVAGFFQAACERKLQDIVETSPDWVSEKIFCPAGT